MKYVKFPAIKLKGKKPPDKFMLPLEDDFYTNICDGGGYAVVEYENSDGSKKERIVLEPEVEANE